MRITGGTVCGHKLSGPQRNQHIRPTSDRVREALFNILGDRISGTDVLDLFAGTGALGLEALSRGAASALFVDNDPKALEIVSRNLQACFPQTSARAFQLDLNKALSLSYLRRQLPETYRFDLVFLDPPYKKKLAEQLLKGVETSGLLSAEALVIVEEEKNQMLPELTPRLRLQDNRRYGKTGLWFYTFLP